MAITNEYSVQWKGSAGYSRSCGTLLLGKKIFKGTLGMAVDGKAEPVLSGTDLVAKAMTAAGADANGGVVVLAKRKNVRYIAVGGTSKTLGVTVAYGANTDVTIQLGTDNADAVTSTGAQVVQKIREHALANELLSAQATGTGAGLAAVKTATAVPFAMLLGFAAKSYGDTGSAADQSIEMEFKCGIAVLASKSGDVPTRAMVGGLVWLEDGVTCRLTPSALDLAVRLVDVDASGYPWIEVR